MTASTEAITPVATTPVATTPVAIVGAGLVGSGWALVFARAGHPVRLFDAEAKIRAGVMDWAAAALADLAREGLVAEPDAVLARLTVCDSLESALDGAGYIQESVFETVESKTKASLAIDAAMGADAVIGSSSSGIPASAFTADCKNRSNFLIAHPVNPPHLVPVVELVPAPWTDPAKVEATRALMQGVGQVPVSLTREIDGFVLNRLQGALLNEAWALLEDGLATVEDIDATVSQGLGLRWAFMGPFETIDLNAPGGIADYSRRLSGLYFGMGHSRKPHSWPQEVIERAEAQRREKLGQDELAERRAWRDRQLMRLAAFKRANGLAG